MSDRSSLFAEVLRVWPEAAVVGGTLRDLRWGLSPKDLDLAMPRPVLAPARSLCDRLGGSYVELDAEWEIARIILADGYQLDLAAWAGDSLEEDLRRRDFSLNALGERLSDGVLVDPCGGLADLEARVLRPTSPAVFPEDPLRLLRAVRFLACKGLTAHPTLDPLLREHAPLLARVSAERVRDELALILESGLSPQVSRLRRTGLWKMLFPHDPEPATLVSLERDDLAWAPPGTRAWLEQPLGGPRPRRLSLALAALGAVFPQPARAEERFFERVSQARPLEVGPDRGERYRWLKHMGPEAVDACVLAHQARPSAHLADLIRSVLTQDEVAAPRLAVDGHDLVRELELPPGPAIGRLLEELAAHTAAHGPLTRAQSLELVQQLL